MTTKNKWPSALLAVAITLVAGAIRAQDQQRQQRTPEGAVSVNDLAGKSGEYLGQVQLIGVVAAVSQGQGFVLVGQARVCRLRPDLRSRTRYKENTGTLERRRSQPIRSPDGWPPQRARGSSTQGGARSAPACAGWQLPHEVDPS
jgi:hypothetical protein